MVVPVELCCKQVQEEYRAEEYYQGKSVCRDCNNYYRHCSAHWCVRHNDQLVHLHFLSTGEIEQRNIAFCFLYVYIYTNNLIFEKVIRMKRNTLIIISLLLGLAVNAQQIKQEVIASAGGYNKSADNSISISWTLGETIIPTFTSDDGSLILTHGFQQRLIITTVEENLEDLVQVTIYPNPTSEMINIQFQTSPDKEILVYLLDASGKLVKTDKIDVATLNKTINMQDLPAGMYYIRLIKDRLVNVYKVVKL